MKINHVTIVLIMMSVSLSLLGLSTILIGHHNHIQLITNFYSVTNLVSDNGYNLIAGYSLLLAALLSLITIKEEQLKPALAIVLIVISAVPLGAMFGSTVWIESLGGFPAIGAGQGIIKYLALFTIGLYFLDLKISHKIKTWIVVAPVILILMWIGCMKFTLLEAQGIEALVSSSPLMSWMYSVWDLQTTSNLIGIYDLIALGLLVAAIYHKKLIVPAVTMSGAVFLVTQTFLFTWDSALSSDTLLSTGGHFLIKDLWFIANMIIFWHLLKEKQNAED